MHKILSLSLAGNYSLLPQLFPIETRVIFENMNFLKHVTIALLCNIVLEDIVMDITEEHRQSSTYYGLILEFWTLCKDGAKAICIQ